ncbi:hypothetical protein [uncultured Cellulomonas sp.]|uniref:hypothetical protein n=1 Tax=uncultured Cellulomonas sp. TaxID=189682 RepID=UPI0028E88495|nr:hypothetical protein [uncultured Cellulomonas sp.]
MSDDLHALLARASTEIEGAAPALDGGRLGLVHAAARRRRIVRRTAESFAGVGAVGVVGAGLWLGLGQQPPEPVVPIETPTVSPTPSVTPTPTPSPTPTPTQTPTGPPTRAEEIDDATVIARLSAPRTGESWQTPVRAPEIRPVLLGDDSTETVFLVGKRGGASIYLTTYELLGSWVVSGLFEVDAQGARLIACPSARASDPCADEPNNPTPAGVARDVETFYDTLTLPASIELGNGFTVTTTSTRGSPSYWYTLYGEAGPLMDDSFAQRVLLDLGPAALVAQERESSLPGLTNLTYGITTPMGTFVRLDPGDVPAGDFTLIRWDDGVARGAPDPADEYAEPAVSVAPGGENCVATTYSVQDAHVPGEWRPAGTTPGGHRVYVPAAGGTPLSRAVRAWHEENSYTIAPEGVQGDEFGAVHGAAAGYPFTTDAAFLEAIALFALQGPTGEWLLGMRSDAINVVYECA